MSASNHRDHSKSHPAGMDRFIQDITKAAGRAVLKKFKKVGVKYMKSDELWDCVTEADLAADKIIIGSIKKKYPTHGIISEESGEQNSDAEYVWIIDPVDGTKNFASHIPLFGVMVSLARNGKVILSAIDMPATGEFFFAKKGRGAYMNGKRIKSARTPSLSGSAGYTGSSLRARTRNFFSKLISTEETRKTLVGSLSSCAAHCYVAAGRGDWIVSLSGKIWDFAPTSLLLQEAGCKVTNTKGSPWQLGDLEIVASNPTLHKQLLKLTKDL